MSYLHEISCDDETYWYSKTVGELGCGHALPALYCLHRGSPEVTFQDYVRYYWGVDWSRIVIENLRM